jgi:hypothetical protein
MKFIIQENCNFSGDETDRLVAALEKNNVEYHILKDQWFEEGFVGGESVFVRGSTEFCQKFDRIWGEYIDLYGLTVENYTYIKYTETIDDEMLNSDYIVLPWHKLYRSLDLLKFVFSSERFFIRPNSGEKLFTGTTLGSKYFTKELDIIKSLPGFCAVDNDLVVVSSAKKIEAEYRLFMHKNTIVDYSPYEINEPVNRDIERDFLELAPRIKKYPDVFYTLDICYSNGKPYILEINSASSAGWYNMDYNKIVEYICETDRREDLCPGCQRPEMHKMCPAYGTEYYMSGKPFTKEIENSYKRRKLKSKIYQRYKSTNSTHPYIWGEGWYAIPDCEKENCWCLAPIKFFDEKGHCPDGWDWEKPEVLSDDEFSDFVDEYGCEPEIPNMFNYCMESTIECCEKISMEQQKQTLKDFGYVVDNVPKWYYERNE